MTTVYGPKPDAVNAEGYSKQMIAEIISDLLEDPDIDVDGNMNSIGKWDSLNHIKIILKIEEKTDYRFSHKEISRATSIDEIHKILSSDRQQDKRE